MNNAQKNIFLTAETNFRGYSDKLLNDERKARASRVRELIRLGLFSSSEHWQMEIQVGDWHAYGIFTPGRVLWALMDIGVDIPVRFVPVTVTYA